VDWYWVTSIYKWGESFGTKVQAVRKVFGLGWAKSGTSTLGRCFEIHGLRHQGPNLGLVEDLARGDLSRILALAGDADGFEDWPWPLLYREMDEAFPGSQFVLTLRASPRWIRSYCNMLRNERDASPRLNLLRRHIYRLPFPNVSAEQLINRYEGHNHAVMDYFRDRPADLLVLDWERGDGWPQLCDFLGLPIPDLPLPHENRGRYAP
jgi:hypothetical protein